MDKDFYKTKSLKELTEEEWEALCDGCGKCCYRKILEGWGRHKRVYNTRVACNLLDTECGQCMDYPNRFKIQKECIHLTPKKTKDFDWLPETCAYRLVHQHKDLPSWHPLISGTKESVKESGIMINNGIHEQDADDWYDYIID